MPDILDLDELLNGAPAPATKKAYDSDVKYFWKWAHVALGISESYPITQETMKQFVDQHVAGLQPSIQQILIDAGVKKDHNRLRVDTIRRRMSAIIKAHKKNGFKEIAFRSEYLKALLSGAKRKETQLGITTRQVQAITRKPLNRILKTFGDKHSLKDTRDLAVFIFGFYTGGRRGSEIINAKFDDVHSYHNGYRYNLPYSKTDQIGKGALKLLKNPHAKYLTAWIKASGITGGYLFRGITPGGALRDKKMNDRAIRNLIKERVEMIGFNPRDFSSHSIRRGFLTQCGMDGYSLRDAMQLTGHTNVETALKYYEAGLVENNEATKMNTKQH